MKPASMVILIGTKKGAMTLVAIILVPSGRLATSGAASQS